VRFRRAAAVADAVREAVRAALASAGYAPAVEVKDAPPASIEVAPEASNDKVEAFSDMPASMEIPAVTPGPIFARSFCLKATTAAGADRVRAR